MKKDEKTSKLQLQHLRIRLKEGELIAEKAALIQ